MFYINSIPAAILFDYGATHLFISARYANTNELPLQNMQKPLIVITPKGRVEANYMTNILTLTIMGREFWAAPIVLEESSIDLILGMSWLWKAKAVEFVIDLLLLTAPISKRSYMMSVEELKELKMQLTKL
jgi:predicted aspartyl protease